MKKVCISAILAVMASSGVMADQYTFEPSSTSTDTVTTTSGINAPIMINRQFTSMQAVLGKLQSLGVNASISVANEKEIVNQTINIDATVKDFIYAAGQKFGYSVTSTNNNRVVFAGLYPPKPKPIPKPTPTPTSVAQPPNTAATAIQVINNWAYSPSDKYLSITLGKWAKQAGYQLIWQADNDYEMQSSGTLNVGFKTAVNEVLKSFKHADNPLKAEWYKNNVVVISNIGN